MLSGPALVADINNSLCRTPKLWWLGLSGFVIKFHSIVVCVNPYLSDWMASQPANEGGGFARRRPAPLKPEEIRNAHLVLATHAHPTAMDPDSLPRILASSPRAKLVLPKSAAEHAHSLGIPYDRMTTTDSGLRIEYFQQNEYVRVYAVPSAQNELDWTPIGGYPYLGYLIRCGAHTIYHAGGCVPYDTLVERLRPYRVTAALLPISGRDPKHGPGNFEIAEAAQLAEDIGARWLAPMHYGVFAGDTLDIGRFVDHMLFHRPAQRFKVFEYGEGWSLPDD
jgi:L-ascorbate metabolism protein UlaG (beta-lactamase superfamily)